MKRLVKKVGKKKNSTQRPALVWAASQRYLEERK